MFPRSGGGTIDLIREALNEKTDTPRCDTTLREGGLPKLVMSRIDAVAPTLIIPTASDKKPNRAELRIDSALAPPAKFKADVVESMRAGLLRA